MTSIKSSIIVFIVTFLIGSLIFGVIAMIAVPKVNDLLAFANAVDGPAQTEDEDNVIESGVPSDSAGGGFTALLIGTDQKPGVKTGNDVSADTIIFVTISESKKSFVYMSLPCRMEVVVDNETMFLGDVYGKKGVDYLCERVTGLTGISINYYATVALEDMAEVIDELGGIEFSVPVNMNYTDHKGKLNIDITRGYQKLSGEEAVNMLRYRGDSFRDRGTRNVNFIQALVRELTASDFKPEAADTYLKLAKYVTTNFGQADLVKYMDVIWSYSEYNVISLDYPGKYATNEDGYTIYRPNTDAAYSLLADYKN